MKIAWATDIHLNFVDEFRAADFCQRILAAGAQSVLLGGDIGESDDLEKWLRFLQEHLDLPIYFVLGNHDYYGGSIQAVQKCIQQMDSRNLFWLPRTGVVSLTPSTALVGHGGWGDAHHGDFINSPVFLSDYLLIQDLREAGNGPEALSALQYKLLLQMKLQELGAEAARILRPHLEEAVQRYRQVIVLTHVPPFPEACWYDGRLSNVHWQPGFTCKAIGDVLLEAFRQHPDCQGTVLCGHTHGDGEAQIRSNLFVRTGGAEYTRPDFRLIEISADAPLRFL